jgi:hypothetical protein
MFADLNRVKPKRLLQISVDRMDRFSGLRSAGDIRLVCHHDEAKPLLPKTVERARNIGWDDHLVDRHRRKRFAIANQGFIEDAVAIEKNRFGGPRPQRTASHFVCRALSAG